MPFSSRRWHAQPPGPERIAGRWRSRVMLAWYPNAGLDVVRGNRLRLNGTGYSVSGGKLYCPGATNSANYADLGYFLAAPDGLAFSYLGIATPTTLTTRGCLLATSQATDGTNFGLTLQEGYSDNTKLFNYTSQGFIAEDFAGYFAANRRDVFGLTYRSSASTFTYYRNGIAAGTASNSGAQLWPVDSLGSTTVGGQFSGNVYGWNGTIELHVFFAQCLSSAEMAELSKNPWQLFEPIQRRIYLNTVAGGAAFNAAWNSAANTVINPGAPNA